MCNFLCWWVVIQWNFITSSRLASYKHLKLSTRKWCEHDMCMMFKLLQIRRRFFGIFILSSLSSSEFFAEFWILHQQKFLSHHLLHLSRLPMNYVSIRQYFYSLIFDNSINILIELWTVSENIVCVVLCGEEKVKWVEWDNLRVFHFHHKHKLSLTSFYSLITFCFSPFYTIHISKRWQQ